MTNKESEKQMTNKESEKQKKRKRLNQEMGQKIHQKENLDRKKSNEK